MLYLSFLKSKARITTLLGNRCFVCVGAKKSVSLFSSLLMALFSSFSSSSFRSSTWGPGRRLVNFPPSFSLPGFGQRIQQGASMQKLQHIFAASVCMFVCMHACPVLVEKRVLCATIFLPILFPLSSRCHLLLSRPSLSPFFLPQTNSRAKWRREGKGAKPGQTTKGRGIIQVTRNFAKKHVPLIAFFRGKKSFLSLEVAISERPGRDLPKIGKRRKNVVGLPRRKGTFWEEKAKGEEGKVPAKTIQT